MPLRAVEVDRMPSNLVAMDSNHVGCWAVFSFYLLSSAPSRLLTDDAVRVKGA